VQNRDKTITDLLARNELLAQENAKLAAKNLDLEGHIRRDNLLFSGLNLTFANVSGPPEESADNLVQQIVTVCNDQLGCNLHASDISAAYTLPAGNNPTSQRQVLVKFIRRRDRDAVYKARTRLKTYNRDNAKKIYINEDLPSVTRSLFGKLRELFKAKRISGCWTSFGKLMAKKINGADIQVKNEMDIRNLLST
jgi:hypothetical protein